MRQSNSWKIIIPLVIGLALYLPSLNTYFSTDDWFLLRISELKDAGQIIKFFSFARNEYTAAFYRPLSQQIFLGVFNKLFGLNPLPYHLFVLFVFGLSSYLVYRVGKELKLKSYQALISMMIYIISAANFPRIYFLSAFQDTLFPLFGVLAVLMHIKEKRTRAYVFLILSLASKESAVVIPGLWLLVDWYFKKINWKRYILGSVTVLIYLYFRLRIFGNAAGDSYIWDFSPKKFANTLMWYGYWGLGAPEFLVDYVGSGLRFLPKYFTELGGFAWGVIVSSLALILAVLILTIKRLVQKGSSFRLAVFCGGYFILGLLSVLFMPWHKFSHHLGLPLAGMAWWIGSLLDKRSLATSILALSFVGLNIQSHYLLGSRHYSVNRAKISQKVSEYMTKNYQSFPKDAPFLFINDTRAESASWGSSKQVSFALSKSDYFKVWYKDDSLEVYYEDLDNEVPLKVTKLSSKQFLE